MKLRSSLLFVAAILTLLVSGGDLRVRPAQGDASGCVGWPDTRPIDEGGGASGLSCQRSVGSFCYACIYYHDGPTGGYLACTESPDGTSIRLCEPFNDFAELTDDF